MFSLRSLFAPRETTITLFVIGCTVTVQVQSAQVLNTLQRIYAAFLIPPKQANIDQQTKVQQADINFSYTLGENRQPNPRYFLTTPNQETLTTDDLGHILFLFEKEMTIELQKQRNALFFVHAAVCGYPEGVFIIAAPSGTGKSTTTWALLHQGFSYLSDELAPIDLTSLQLWAYPRALGLKRVPPFYALPASHLSTSAGLQVMVENLPGGYRCGQHPLRALFFLEFDPQGKELVIEPVSQATATAKLYSNALNPLAHQSKGLAAATQVAQQIPGFRIVTNPNIETVGEAIRVQLASLKAV